MQKNTTQTQYNMTTRLGIALAGLVLSVSCAKPGNYHDPDGGTSSGGSSSGSNSGSSSGGTFSGGYKPEPLSWESSSHPERAAWSKSAYDLVAANLSTLDTADDVTTFCPYYDSLTRNQKINLWADIFAATAYYECAWNPKSGSVDVGNASDKDTWSVGLLQLSVVDQPNYGLNYGYSYSDLQDPTKNLRLGIAIMAKQVKKRGVIAIPTGMSGLYWATLHPGGKYDKTSSIAKMTKRHSFCQ